MLRLDSIFFARRAARGPRRLALDAFCLLACGGALLRAGDARAQEIKVGKLDCRTGIHLVARNARASDVLKAMSTTLGFSLTLERNVDSLVNIDTQLAVSELIPRVLPDENVITSQKKDPQCPGKYRLAGVWVLTRGDAPTPAVRTVPVTPEAREAEQLYMRAHGMLPEDPAEALKR